MPNVLRHELFNIISGKSKVSNGAIIQTITDYLRESEKTGGIAKTEKHFKKQETKRLEEFIVSNNLWFLDVNADNYVSEGAEQKSQ
jgi:hypothetical protein